MTLRIRSLAVKVSFLIVGLFISFGLVQFGVQKKILYPSFVALENAEAEKNLGRALDALQREVESLGPQVTDWATWDDTYAFVQDHNTDYVAANLNAEALENLRINYLAFVDTSGTPVWQLAIGLELPASLTPTDLGFANLAGDDPLVRLGQPGYRASADRAHAVVGVRASARGDHHRAPAGRQGCGAARQAGQYRSHVAAGAGGFRCATCECAIQRDSLRHGDLHRY